MPTAYSIIIVVLIICIVAIGTGYCTVSAVKTTPATTERMPRPSGKLGRISTPIPAPRPSEREVNEAIARAGLAELWRDNQAVDINSEPSYALYDGTGGADRSKFQTKGYDMQNEIRLRSALRETHESLSPITSVYKN